MFEDFINDPDAWNMYIVGSAGTGKTTSLADYVKYCIDNSIPYIVCAYTHKACNILRSKLPKKAFVATLHSFLSKRPTVNTDATKREQVNNSTKVGKTLEEPRIIFIDEYSMVGEKDRLDINEAQDPEYVGKPKVKVVYIGDLNQLPAVNDAQGVKPEGKYQLHLTKQYRNDNPLQEPLNKLISYINKTADPALLEPVPDYFIRGIDIDNEPITEPDRIYLAYTNKRVQQLNESIQGYDRPKNGDILFSPTTQHIYQYDSEEEFPTCIDIHYSDPLHLGSKYKTLENLIKAGHCSFANVYDEEGEPSTFAYVFGHYNYKVKKEELEQAAVKANKDIEKEFKGYKATAWAKANPQHPLARARAKAWREYLSFTDTVICLDFNHAMTVHKSQGSTYNTVIIDTDDIAIAADRNFDIYLKLMYTAISRASHKVITT